MEEPRKPSELAARAWWGVLKRTVGRFRANNLTDWAAALTYYGLLSLFPALIALVSVIGLFADPQAAAHKLTQIVTAIGPRSAGRTFAGPIDSITSSQATSGVLFVGGLALALWSASGYVGTFMRASNVIYESPEGRPYWKLRPLQVLVALIMVVLLALVAAAVTLTGPVVPAVADPLGIGGFVQTVWQIGKWPVLLAIVITMIAVLYHASPNVRQPFRWVTPGSVVAVAVWLAGSVSFAFFVANFGSYDATYGALSGVVVALVWIWISNLALLVGHELNAELERSRELASGLLAAERELQLKPRAAPKRPRQPVAGRG